MTGGLVHEGVAEALSESAGRDLSKGQAHAGTAKVSQTQAKTPSLLPSLSAAETYPRPADGRGIKGEGKQESGERARVRCSDSLSASDGERAGVRCFGFLVPLRFIQFIKFCCVGGSGVMVDMGVLALLADPRFLGWNVLLSKICAAEVAMTNNFIWNELWTFRKPSSLSAIGGEGRGEVVSAGASSDGERAGVRCPVSEIPNVQSSGLLRRFLTFNAICGIGIALAVLLLHLFHSWLGWNLYASNLLAIILVTCWNFGISARFNWQTSVE